MTKVLDDKKNKSAVPNFVDRPEGIRWMKAPVLTYSQIQESSKPHLLNNS